MSASGKPPTSLGRMRARRRLSERFGRLFHVRCRNKVRLEYPQQRRQGFERSPLSAARVEAQLTSCPPRFLLFQEWLWPLHYQEPPRDELEGYGAGR